MLKNILGSWLNKTSNNDEQARINNLPKHEQARLMVDKMVQRRGRPFNPIKAASVQLQCIDRDVLAFIDRLNQYSAKLEMTESLTPQETFAEVKVVTLDAFFTDTEGMYIPLTTVDDLAKSATRLFAAINRGLASKNRDVEYSLRLMGKCFSSVMNICKAIEEAAK